MLDTEKNKSKKLGIFSGKKAGNNKLILKSLLLGDKIDYEIARYIVANSKETGKNVKSVLKEIRRMHREPNKYGRLQELSTKGYIEKSENNPQLWTLSGKGLGVALTLFKYIEEILPYITQDNKKIIDGFRRFSMPSMNMLEIRKKTKRKIISLMKKALASKKSYQSIKRRTQKMINNGVNFDSMSDENFLSCVIMPSLNAIVGKKLRLLSTYEQIHRRMRI